MIRALISLALLATLAWAVTSVPPFIVQPTGQVVTENPVEVEIDGWMQANIDIGLLIKVAP